MLKLGKTLSFQHCLTLKKYRGVTGEKIKFMGETFINVFFNGKERKLKALVMCNS